MEKADKVFLEVDPQMPRVPGSNIIHISQADAVCEAEYSQGTLPQAPISDLNMQIGSLIAEQVTNGATVQFGIGGIPNAVGKCLDNKRNLGIHTELFTDSMDELVKKGIVNNRFKTLNKGKSVAAFAWGSQHMYDFLNDNIAVEMHPVSYVNNPYISGQLDFVRGCNTSKGGKSFIAIASTAKGGELSKIKPTPRCLCNDRQK